MRLHDDQVIVDAMKVYGGSFMQALANLAERADPDNLARIKAAWPEYWAEYKETAKLMLAKYGSDGRQR